MKAYNILHESYKSLTGAAKKEAYEQVSQVHADISGMPNTSSIPKKEGFVEVEKMLPEPGLHAKDFIIIGSFFVLIAVVLFGNAGALGFVALETHAPVWNGVREFSTTAGVPFVLDLSTAFRDPDGDVLAFVAVGGDGISVALKGSVVTVFPEKSGTITLMASDSTHLTKVPITIKV